MNSLVLSLGGLAVALAAFGGWTVYQRHEAVAAYEQKIAAQQAQIQKQTDEAVRAAQQDIDNMQAAYDAGKEKARVIKEKVYIKGQQDVAKYPVFSNPVCVLPDDSVRNLNLARSGLLTPTGIAGAAAAMPGPATAAGRQAGDAVPANAAGRGAVSGVPAPPRAVSGGNTVSRPSVGQHPKPSPKSKQ